MAESTVCDGYPGSAKQYLSQNYDIDTLASGEILTGNLQPNMTNFDSSRAYLGITGQPTEIESGQVSLILAKTQIFCKFSKDFMGICFDGSSV